MIHIIVWNILTTLLIMQFFYLQPIDEIYLSWLVDKFAIFFKQPFDKCFFFLPDWRSLLFLLLQTDKNLNFFSDKQMIIYATNWQNLQFFLGMIWLTKFETFFFLSDWWNSWLFFWDWLTKFSIFFVMDWQNSQLFL